MKRHARSPNHGHRRMAHAFALFAAAPLAFMPLVAPTHANETHATIQRVVSPGGIVAWLRETHHAPAVSFNIRFRGGSWHDPLGKSGLAQATAYLFNEGMGNLRSREVLGELRHKAITLVANADAEYFTIKLSTPLVHKERAFELLRLALYGPRFDAAPLAEAKRVQLARLRSNGASPHFQGAMLLLKTLFVDPKLTRSPDGTPADLRTITITEIAKFRQKTLTRDTMVIGVAGAISARELAPVLDRIFANLPAQSGHAPAPLPPGASEQISSHSDNQSVCYQNLSLSANIGHSTVMMNNLVPVISNIRQRMAAGIAAHIIGGDSSSRLFTEIRERRGLVYGINSTRTEFNRFGMFGVAFSTGQNAMAVRKKVLEMLREFEATGPTTDEFKTAKRAFRGGHHFALLGNTNMAEKLVFYQLVGRPITFLDDYNRILDSITLADVTAAARNLIRPDTMAVLTVGPQRPGATPNTGKHVFR